MTSVMTIFRAAKLAAVLAAVLGLGGLRQQPDRSSRPGSAGAAVPGSAQDFVVNVGDRVFFETDSTELTPQARTTLDKQAQWLQHYNRYSFTIEGHADERGTREYNIALGARRAPGGARLPGIARHRAPPDADDLLRQGAPGRGVRRHLVLVAEPARRHRAQREQLSHRPSRRDPVPAPATGAGFVLRGPGPPRAQPPPGRRAQPASEKNALRVPSRWYRERDRCRSRRGSISWTIRRPRLLTVILIRRMG